MTKQISISIFRILLFAFFLFPVNSFAQPDIMPHFSMVQENGVTYTYKDLPSNKPVILIYFAPDCEHCQKLLNRLFIKIKEFTKAEIILITFKPLSDVKGFVQQYKTYKYKNVKVGTEGNSYLIRYYYNLSKTPFTALFNRNKKLVISYKDQTPIDDLISHLRRIN